LMGMCARCGTFFCLHDSTMPQHSTEMRSRVQSQSLA
jgi:hypothetical protein